MKLEVGKVYRAKPVLLALPPSGSSDYSDGGWLWVCEDEFTCKSVSTGKFFRTTAPHVWFEEANDET